MNYIKNRNIYIYIMNDDHWGHFVDIDMLDQDNDPYINKHFDFESSFLDRTDSIYDFEGDPFAERITLYFRGIIITLIVGWYFFI